MSSQSPALSHIELTETLVRLYVFLAQYLDRCLDEDARRSFPEADLQGHLSTTKARALDLLSVNHVVKAKVQAECDRVLELGAAWIRAGKGKTSTEDDLKAERAALQHKTIALSDLLAVFRAV